MITRLAYCLILSLLLSQHASGLYLAFWDDNVSETNSFTSLTFTLSDVDQLKAASALGLTNLWNTQSYFIQGTANGYVLRPDWQQKWTQVKPGQLARMESDVADIHLRHRHGLPLV
eukprot:m.52699 g.52699  ORF g.52699 m.52699 type:complete len:116 (-) comp13521_c0_seq6:1460-1807(-)